jgi:hypothetical protein
MFETIKQKSTTVATLSFFLTIRAFLDFGAGYIQP